MRALILNGALKGDDGLRPIEELLAVALALRSWEVERVHLRDRTIAYCQGCFDCWVRTPGLCKTKDAGPELARALVHSDLFVLLSPVTFGGYSSEIKKALDRCICIVSPFFMRIDGEVHHKPRYDKYPALLGVGVMAERDEEEERIFSTLVSRNAVNFHAPAHASGMLHRGDTPEQMQATIGALVGKITSRKRGAA